MAPINSINTEWDATQLIKDAATDTRRTGDDWKFVPLSTLSAPACASPLPFDPLLLLTDEDAEEWFSGELSPLPSPQDSLAPSFAVPPLDPPPLDLPPLDPPPLDLPPLDHPPLDSPSLDTVAVGQDWFSGELTPLPSPLLSPTTPPFSLPLAPPCAALPALMVPPASTSTALQDSASALPPTSISLVEDSGRVRSALASASAAERPPAEDGPANVLTRFQRRRKECKQKSRPAKRQRKRDSEYGGKPKSSTSKQLAPSQVIKVDSFPLAHVARGAFLGKRLRGLQAELWSLDRVVREGVPVYEWDGRYAAYALLRVLGRRLRGAGQ